MKFSISLADWSVQAPAAREVRTEVFLVEQGVPLELEWDDMDTVCVHAVALDAAGQIIGTGRLLPDAHIGRMAVKKSVRGAGVGSAILQALMQQARQHGHECVLLNAQVQVVPFYERFGFVCEGEPFPDAGIAHIRMRCCFKD